MTDDAPDLQYFQRLYSRDEDPWQISVGFYEQRKRQLLLDSLPQQRFHHAFEPGCAAGELTAALATRCDTLLAADANAEAVRIARERLATTPSVEIQQLIVPAQWPSEIQFDLTVLSEIGYFMKIESWRTLAASATQSLAAEGTIVACHWKHAFAQRRSETAELHYALGSACAEVNARSCLHLEDEDFLLDVWTRMPTSPAQRENRV